jgi:hypothetical protein
MPGRHRDGLPGFHLRGGQDDGVHLSIHLVVEDVQLLGRVGLLGAKEQVVDAQFLRGLLGAQLAAHEPGVADEHRDDGNGHLLLLRPRAGEAQAGGEEQHQQNQ